MTAPQPRLELDAQIADAFDVEPADRGAVGHAIERRAAEIEDDRDRGAELEAIGEAIRRGQLRGGQRLDDVDVIAGRGQRRRGRGVVEHERIGDVRVHGVERQHVAIADRASGDGEERLGPVAPLKQLYVDRRVVRRLGLRRRAPRKRCNADHRHGAHRQGFAHSRSSYASSQRCRHRENVIAWTPSRATNNSRSTMIAGSGRCIAAAPDPR